MRAFWDIPPDGGKQALRSKVHIFAGRQETLFGLSQLDFDATPLEESFDHFFSDEMVRFGTFANNPGPSSYN
jgi:hypothetical protein